MSQGTFTAGESVVATRRLGDAFEMDALGADVALRAQRSEPSVVVGELA